MLSLPTLRPSDLERLSRQELVALALRAKAIEERQAQRLFFEIYPDEDMPWRGPTLMGGLIQPGQMLYARDKYPKQMEFFDASKEYRETCFMAANRVGKTFSGGGYAMACHLTGIYPDWWPGRKFTQPVSAWAAGDTYETTRDIIQLTLLGEITTNASGRKALDGRGIIPGHLLGRNTWRSGVQDLVDVQIVKHVSGGNSFLQFKSTDQGRRAFQGTGRHVVWLDEECPVDVYGECLIRTATVNGIIMLTFTPLKGLSEVVLSFLPADQRPELAT